LEYYNDIKFPDHNCAALIALVGIMEKHFVNDKVWLEIWVGDLTRSVYKAYEEAKTVSAQQVY